MHFSRIGSSPRKALIGVLASIVATGLIAASTASTSTAATIAASAGKEGRAKQTIVLVHGAFADTSSWNNVARRLQRDGYHVVAPANPLRGLSGDAAYLSSVLDTVAGPIVLVGHSYGGAIMSQAASGDSDVKALVYIAGFIPDVGEAAVELANKFPGSTLAENVTASSYPLSGGGTGTELIIKQDKYRQQFAADVPPIDAAILAATQRPVSTMALEEKATKTPAWRHIPTYVLIAGKDYNIPPKAQQWMAERANARTVTLKDASHSAPVSRSAEVTSLILRAAHTTR